MNEWEKLKEKVKIGDFLIGKVSRHRPFGVFVDLEETPFDGLIQIVDFGPNLNVESPHDYPEIGQLVKGEVLGFKETGHQIWLRFDKTISLGG